MLSVQPWIRNPQGNDKLKFAANIEVLLELNTWINSSEPLDIEDKQNIP